MTKHVRIEIGEGWYPMKNLILEYEGQDVVIESIEPDPDALYRISIPGRTASRLSVIATVRPATEIERSASRDQERRDTAEFLLPQPKSGLLDRLFAKAK